LAQGIATTFRLAVGSPKVPNRRGWPPTRVITGVGLAFMAEIKTVSASGSQSQVGPAEALLPLVCQKLRRLAAGYLAKEKPGQTLQPTALVHEAWRRLASAKYSPWHNWARFFGAAAQAMRRILVENARRKERLKRGGQ